MESSAPSHDPVLVDEALLFLRPERGGTFVDCTVGLGGHTAALVTRGATRVIGIDRDAEALAIASDRLGSMSDRVELVHADYRAMSDVLSERGITTVDGILADLGVSSLQFDSEGRGFSFKRDEPLDMRMDRSSGRSAADLVNAAKETELADVIFRYGEERQSRRIARAIVGSRPITTTGTLASVVRRAIPGRGWQRIDPATRTFQAIRIWVNAELEGLDGFLQIAVDRLAPSARLCVIAFHSLEDRIVKHTMRALAQDATGFRVLTKKPIVPDEAEIRRNPRSRSAKLRAIERQAA